MNNAWNQLYKNSKQLTQGTSAHNVFSDEDIAFVEERLKQVFTTFLNKKETHRTMKVYVNQQLKQGYIDEMVKTQPKEDQSLEEWCASIFGDNKFGFIFNTIEAFDNALVERMCEIMHPILEKAGLPLGGLSFLFFMGNYGFTPFGIHKEAKGEEGFLFHMGPSPKTFYTWDIEEYNQIEHNTEVFHNVQEMLPSAESYELRPKSVMFIPNHLYHIANTEEFSFSVVMDYINPSRHALESLIAEKISEEMKDSSKITSYLSPISLKEPLDSSVLSSSPSWEEKYNRTLKRHLYRLKSNHGVLLPAIAESGNHITTDDFSIAGKPLFPVFEYTDQNDQSFLIIRGNEIRTKKNRKLASVLQDLNKGKEFSFQELKEILLEDWTLQHLYAFLDNLFRHAAIQKIES